MARETGHYRDDDEHRRILPCQLDQLRSFFRWWCRRLAIPACIPGHLPFRLVGYYPMASRVSSVGTQILLLFLLLLKTTVTNDM
jgi:hypothetical protein